jgi:predicted peptidase
MEQPQSLHQVVPMTDLQAQNLTWNDCDAETDKSHGPFGPASFFNATYEEKPIYGYVPQKDSDQRKFPLLVYMHGIMGPWGFYDKNLELFSTHGAVVVFPFIEGPNMDKLPWVTNTDGTYILRAVEYAKAANKDPSSPMYDTIDEDNIVIGGHSMGATDAIMASQKLPPVKLTIA